MELLDRSVVEIRVMPFKLFRCCSFFAVFLFGFPLFAGEGECITSSFANTDAATEDAVLHHLKTELRIPIYRDEGPPSCWHLVIELQDKTSNISLARQQAFNTVIHLDDFLPVFWPRAIALSTSGLWILAHDQPDAAHGASQPDNAEIDSGRAVGTAPPQEEKPPPAETRDSPEPKAVSADDSYQTKNSNRSVRFHLLVGARLIPKFSVGILELSAGTSIFVSSIQVDLTLLGLWGRKALEPGRIYTTGGGIRAAVFWQAVERRNLSFGIGPAVEALGIFGYGRGDESVLSRRAFYPVINCLVLAGGGVGLTPRTTLQMAVGGGFSAVYFNMRVDGKAVTGMSGGSVNFILGISIGP
jgi:hypothetical protein